MFRKLALALALSILSSAAFAQQVQCPTRPPGNNTNACASTAFVTAAFAAYTITVGTTGITGGVSGRVLYDNAGIVGEYPISGTGSVAMTNSPVFVTPTLGVATATQLKTGVTSSPYPIANVADASSRFLAFEKAGVRTWNLSYESTALAADANSNTLKILSDRGAGLSTYITDYGFLSMGNLHTQFPNLTCNALISTTLCADIGPALRIYGDMVAGDYLYFGASSAAGVEVQQIGTRLSGAFPSATRIGAGEIGFTNDATGSASIDLFPDSACANCTPSGTMRLRAHGSVGGTDSNQIEFWTRTGVNAESRRWYVNSGGTFMPDSDVSKDIGASATRVAQIYALGLNGGTVAATGPQARPGGRLTLTTSVPVLIADTTGATTIYYTPYQTDFVPIYDGTRWTGYQFAELSVSMAANAAWASGSIYDWFVARDGSTTRLCSGPAWTSTSGRGTGAGTTQLTLTSGIYLNTVSMTCRYATGSTFTAGALTATYVGSSFMTANGTTGMQFAPTRASGGSNNILGVYNAYNRVEMTSREGDSTATWTYATATWRAANGNANNSIRFVDGLAQSFFSGHYEAFVAPVAGGAGYAMGCALGWSSGAPDFYGITNPNIGTSVNGHCQGPAALGLNTVTALEQAFDATATNTVSGGAAQSLSIRVSL